MHPLKTKKAMKTRNDKLIIFSTDLYCDDEAKKNWWEETRDLRDEEITIEDMAMCLGISCDDITKKEESALEVLLPLYRKAQGQQEPDDSDWYKEVDYIFDTERAILNKELNAYIVKVGDIGLWDTRACSLEIVGTNISDIMHFDDDCEYSDWYGDGYNIRSRQSHHDGTNYNLYRIIDSKEEYEKLLDAAYSGTLTEKKLLRATRSLYPYVANIYGWTILNHYQRRVTA